jgi:hypothetical protein
VEEGPEPEDRKVTDKQYVDLLKSLAENLFPARRGYSYMAENLFLARRGNNILKEYYYFHGKGILYSLK